MAACAVAGAVRFTKQSIPLPPPLSVSRRQRAKTTQRTRATLRLEVGRRREKQPVDTIMRCAGDLRTRPACQCFLYPCWIRTDLHSIYSVSFVNIFLPRVYNVLNYGMLRIWRWLVSPHMWRGILSHSALRVWLSVTAPHLNYRCAPYGPSGAGRVDTLKKLAVIWQSLFVR